jgi:hypothetical protein
MLRLMQRRWTLVNDGIVLADVPFKAISNYLSLPPGTYNVKVVPTGATTPVVIDADLTIDAGVDYTVTLGLLPTSPRWCWSTTTATRRRQRPHPLVHLSPDAPAVDMRRGRGR